MVGSRNFASSLNFYVYSETLEEFFHFETMIKDKI